MHAHAKINQHQIKIINRVKYGRAGRKKGDAHLRGGAGGMGRALVREEKLWRTTRVTARARRLFERMPEPRCASEVTLPWFHPCVLYHMLQIKSSSWFLFQTY